MRTCRECGCTDEQGCPGGCVSIEVDLCSSCAAGRLAGHELIQAPVALELPMLSWLAVHGNLLLALRHPENAGTSRQLVEDVVAALEGLFLDSGLLSEEQLAAIRQVEAEQPRVQVPQEPLIILARG